MLKRTSTSMARDISNDSHASTTDPDAKLYRKGKDKETKLCFIRHGLIENRYGLLVEACLTLADEHAERVAWSSLVPTRRQRSRLAPTKPTTRKTSSTNCAR
jgi:hypothetical protein